VNGDGNFTIAVCGLGRSGTTMVARVIQALGVDMGSSLTPRTCEDKILQVAIANNDPKAFAEHCTYRNSQSDVWAFKVPRFRSKINEYSDYLRNPRLIVTFRDPLAVALSNMYYLGLPSDKLMTTLDLASREITKLVREIDAYGHPAMLVPYELALKYPSELVMRVAQFCGVTTTQSLIDDVTRLNIINKDTRYTG
jgi:hypothetical protein